jgi:hypothetical protein
MKALALIAFLATSTPAFAATPAPALIYDGICVVNTFAPGRDDLAFESLYQGRLQIHAGEEIELVRTENSIVSVRGQVGTPGEQVQHHLYLNIRRASDNKMVASGKAAWLAGESAPFDVDALTEVAEAPRTLTAACVRF